MLEPRAADPALVHLGPRGEPFRQQAQVVDHRRIRGRPRSRRGRGCRRSARRSRCSAASAGEVGVVLLARAGAVQHHHRGPRALPRPGATGTTRCRRAPGLVRRLDVQLGGHNARQYGGYRSQPRVPARHARQRTRPPRGGRLRRGRAGRALRHSRVHLRRGRHARAGARLRGGVPGAHGRLRGDLRVQGAADHRRLPGDGRGGAVGGRGLRRRAVPRAAGRRRSAAHLHARQQQDRGRAEDGVRRGHRLPRAGLIRGDRALRAASEPLAGCADPGHARDQALHPQLRADGPARLQVRLRARGRARDGGRAAGARVEAAQPRRHPRPHRLPDLRAGALHAHDRAAGRLHRLRLPPAERGRRARHRLHGRGRARLDRGLRGRQGEGRAGRLRPGAAHPDRAGPLAGRQRGHHRVPDRHDQGDPRRAHLRRRRRRHVRQPAPDALRLALRRRDRGSARRDGHAARDDRRHALRVGRHPDQARSRCRTRRSATCS